MVTINEYVDTLINARRYDIVNEAKVVKRTTSNNSRYTYLTLNRKIKGVSITCDSDDENYVHLVDSTAKIIEKEYNKIIAEASKCIYDYHTNWENTEFKKRYSSAEQLTKDVKLYGVIFTHINKTERHNEQVCYHMTFDTNPSLDEHVFTLYVTIDISNNTIIGFDSVYDG